MSKVMTGKQDKKSGKYGVVDGTITTKVQNAVEDAKVVDVDLKRDEEISSTCNNSNIWSILVILFSLVTIIVLARIMVPPEEEEAGPTEISPGVTHYEYHYTRQDDYNNDWYTATDFDTFVSRL